MYTDIRTEPCVAHHRDSDILNTSYNQLPFYFNAHKKEPSDLSSRRKVERHPDYNHLNHQQRNEDDTEELEARVEQSDVPIKRTVVGCFKDFPSKGCTFSSTKVLGGLLTTALVVSCLALLLAIIALSIRGKPSLSSGINGLQLMDEIKQLQSQVGIIQEKQNLMNNSINEQKLTKEIEHLQNQVEALQESQTTLRSLVDTLKNQVNSQIDLYQNCIEETRSCVMGQNQPNLFRRECVTGQVPIEEPVSTSMYIYHRID